MKSHLEQLYSNMLEEGDDVIIELKNDRNNPPNLIERYLQEIWNYRQELLDGEWDNDIVQEICDFYWFYKTGTKSKGPITDCDQLMSKVILAIKKMGLNASFQGPPLGIVKRSVVKDANESILNFPDFNQVISVESSHIKYHIDHHMTTKKHLVDIVNINRSIIEELLDRYYQCYSVSFAFLMILNVLFDSIKVGEADSFKQLSPAVQNWITGIEKLVVSSVQGFLFRNGFQYLSDNMVMKISQNSSDQDLIHEYYIGLRLNQLRQEIPNFMFVYGMFKCDNKPPLCDKSGKTNFMLSEMIKGDTFTNSVVSGTLSIKECFTAIIQVLYALQIAYDKHGFVHKDLHLANVMIRKRRSKETLKYTIRGETKYMVTDFFATIIDFGHSVMNASDGGRPFSITKFRRDWMNDHSPAIDIFKMITNFILLLEQKNDEPSNNVIRLIETAFANLGVTDISRESYFYPAKYDAVLMNIQPYQFAQALLDLLPDIDKPDLYDIPPPGFTISSESLCSNTDNIIKKMTTLPKFGNACRGDPWMKLSGHWKDKFGNDRYWFECGKYYFDGIFNVITFPKNMSLYHGSRQLAYYNVKYPLGIKYFDMNYNWMGSDGIKFLKSNAPIEEKKSLIEERTPFVVGYYGDQEVANSYSAQQSGSEACGMNCTFAFKLVKDATFVDLYDPYNLMVLITSDEFLSKQGKKVLEKAYKITGQKNFMDMQKTFGAGFNNLPKNMYPLLQQAFNPFRRFLIDSTRGSLRNPDYLVPTEMLKSIIPRGYAGFCNPRSPYTSGTLKGQYRFAELVFGKNVLDYVERDFTNPFDWQYFDNKRLFGEIGKLINDMKMYETLNINFHQGDLYQHSVWVALYIQNQFTNSTEWVQGIPYELRDLCVISGFLHDIGKGGDLLFTYYDKPEHPETGFEYIIGNKLYRLSEDNVALDIATLLKNINVSPKYKGVVAFLVLSHWEFGDHIRRMNGSNTSEIAIEYASKLKKMWTRSGLNPDTDSAVILANMAMLVSACDIMGSEAYMNTERFDELAKELAKKPDKIVNDLNEHLKSFEYIVNTPKVHRGAPNYERFGIGTKGLILRKEVLSTVSEQNTQKKTWLRNILRK